MINFLDAVVNLISSSEMTEEDKVMSVTYIQDNKIAFTQSPQDRSNENKSLQGIMLVALLTHAEMLYGLSDGSEIHPHPFFEGQVNSRVSRMNTEAISYGVDIGRYAHSWEDVLYEISHEAIHLLNPLPTTIGVKVCTLDEGIAVKFAEKIYSEFITTYTHKPPKNSPIADGMNPYKAAFQVAVKIQDDILKQVRETLGAFHSITDFEGLKSIVKDYISDGEADLLFSQFNYPVRGPSSTQPTLPILFGRP